MTDQSQTTSQKLTPQDEKAIMDQIALESFVDNIMREKNDTSIPEKDIPAIKHILLSEVNNSINIHLINKLGMPQQIELDKLMDTDPSDHQLNQFFIKNIPNLEVEIAAALLNFRAAYLYPLREQIARAVETIMPKSTQPTLGQEENKTEEVQVSSVTPAAQDIQKNMLDFELPKAPTAPLDPNASKKWN